MKFVLTLYHLQLGGDWAENSVEGIEVRSRSFLNTAI